MRVGGGEQVLGLMTGGCRRWDSPCRVLRGLGRGLSSGLCGSTLCSKPLSIVWGVLQGGVVVVREFTHIWAMAHQAAHRRPLMPSAALLGEGRPPDMRRWGPGAWAAAPATLHPH